jgi:hypothetical protein
VVGKSGDFVMGTEQAFIWDAANGMRSLHAVLTAAGVDLAAWTLDGAASISADGRTVVGTGDHAGVGIEAFAATLPRVSVPALQPWSLGLLSCGIVAIGFYGVRRSEHPR